MPSLKCIHDGVRVRSGEVAFYVLAGTMALMVGAFGIRGRRVFAKNRLSRALFLIVGVCVSIALA